MHIRYSFICVLAVLLLCPLDIMALVPSNNCDSSVSGVVVLTPAKSFVEQLKRESTIYEVQNDFDLRQEITGLRLNKSFLLNGKRYYRNTQPFSLMKGQGVWVSDGILIVDGKGVNILSNDGFFLPQEETVVCLAAKNERIVDYQVSGVITMPADCVLRFNGGSLNNGIIRSVRTQIQAEPVRIFGDNMFFGWYWDIDDAYAEWFGAKGEPEYDDAVPIQRCIDSFKRVHLVNHSYYCSKTIQIPSHTRIYGRGLYQTSMVFTSSLDCMLAVEDKSVATEFEIYRMNLSPQSKDVVIKKGIFVSSATRSKIESVSVSSVETGFALNSFFGSKISSCTAYDCAIGFFIGYNGGNSTSIDYDNCYANKCKTGHLFRKCSYITTKNTSADFCETAYDFVESTVTLISPGAEMSKFFLKIVPHTDISTIGNYAHNNIYVINGQSILNEDNDE